jgi:SHS2 domain-containing protein
VYRWVEHTAEVELELDGQSEEEVLREALSALAELLGEAGDRKPDERREVEVGARDRPALLAAWLEELAFLAESQGFVATRVESIELGGDRLRAVVAGYAGDPPPLVKAVTYHRLQFEPSPAGYVARVVFDV